MVLLHNGPTPYPLTLTFFLKNVHRLIRIFGRSHHRVRSILLCLNDIFQSFLSDKRSTLYDKRLRLNPLPAYSETILSYKQESVFPKLLQTVLDGRLRHVNQLRPLKSLLWSILFFLHLFIFFQCFICILHTGSICRQEKEAVIIPDTSLI